MKYYLNFKTGEIIEINNTPVTDEDSFEHKVVPLRLPPECVYIGESEESAVTNAVEYYENHTMKNAPNITFRGVIVFLSKTAPKMTHRFEEGNLRTKKTMNALGTLFLTFSALILGVAIIWGLFFIMNKNIDETNANTILVKEADVQTEVDKKFLSALIELDVDTAKVTYDNATVDEKENLIRLYKIQIDKSMDKYYTALKYRYQEKVLETYSKLNIEPEYTQSKIAEFDTHKQYAMVYEKARMEIDIVQYDKALETISKYSPDAEGYKEFALPIIEKMQIATSHEGVVERYKDRLDEFYLLENGDNGFAMIQSPTTRTSTIVFGSIISNQNGLTPMFCLNKKIPKDDFLESIEIKFGKSQKINIDYLERSPYYMGTDWFTEDGFLIPIIFNSNKVNDEYLTIDEVEEMLLAPEVTLIFKGTFGTIEEKVTEYEVDKIREMLDFYYILLEGELVAGTAN